MIYLTINSSVLAKKSKLKVTKTVGIQSKIKFKKIAAMISTCKSRLICQLYNLIISRRNQTRFKL